MRVSDGPVGARGTRFDGEAVHLCAVQHAARRHVGPDARASAIGAAARPRDEGQGRQRAAGAHRQPPPHARRRPQLRVHERGPVPHARASPWPTCAGCSPRAWPAASSTSSATTPSSSATRSTRASTSARCASCTCVPFEAAVTRGRACMAVMTAYNRINGPWSADSPLLADVLRGEWGFDGLVMSDWFGLHSTVEGVEAGLDLEMPGPTLHRGEQLLAAVERGEVSVDDVRALARRVLQLMAAHRRARRRRPRPRDHTPRRRRHRPRAPHRGAGHGAAAQRAGHDGARPVLPLQLRRRAPGRHHRPQRRARPGDGRRQRARHAHVGVARRSMRSRAYFAAAGVEVVHAAGLPDPPAPARARPAPLRRRHASTSSTTRRSSTTPAATPVSTGTTGTMRLMWVADPTGQGCREPAFGVRMRHHVHARRRRARGSSASRACRRRASSSTA